MRATIASETNMAANIRLSVTVSTGNPIARAMTMPGM